MKKGTENMNKNTEKNIFYKTNPRVGISLIVLVITIIVIIILAAAVIVSIINNNPMSEANEARIKSDVSNMQSVFTNAVGKVMAENQDVVTIAAGPLNTVTSGAKSAVGNVVYKFADGTSGEIIFDTLEKDGLKYYTGRKLPLYNEKTTWYVDEDGIISLEVGNERYGDGKIIKNIKIVTEVIPSEEYIKKNATVKIEVESEDEIADIKFGGNNIAVPEKKEGKYVVEVEVTENGEYEIEATGKGGGKNTVKVEVNVIDVVNEEIKINSAVTLKDEFIKTVANVRLEIEHSGEIDSIKINGESVVVPSKTGGKYIVNKEVTKNGEYKVEVRSKDGTVNSKVVKVEIIETLNANIRIDATVSPTSGYVNADIYLTITYSGEVSSIKINEENMAVPSKTNGKYSLSKIVTENGKYNVEVVAKDGTKNRLIVIVNQITEDMEIWNKADMENFRNKANSGRTFAGRTVKVMQNFDLQGNASNQWIPINNFAGTFEGNKHTISNLYINSNAYRNSGFFSVNTGVIQNLILSNVNITNTISNESVGSNTGGIVGTNSNTIINCGVTGGNIIGQNTAHTNAFNCVLVGGIAGSNNANIRGCYNKANVSAKDNNSNTDYRYAYSSAGGIAGYSNTPSSISECYNTGTIYAIATSSFRGGIVGTFYDDSSSTSYITVKNCYSVGSLSGGEGERECYYAGIVARNGWSSSTYHKIINCFSTTNIVYYYYSSGRKANTAGCVSITDLKNYAGNLGSAFKSDTSNKNGGYPILSWQ